MLPHRSDKQYFKSVKVDGYDLMRVSAIYLGKLLQILWYVQTAIEICKYKICCYIRGKNNFINGCQYEVLRSPSLYSVFYMHEHIHNHLYNISCLHYKMSLNFAKECVSR